jgi:hypothetical protein
MKISIRFFLGITLSLLLPVLCFAQSRNPAVDSMGANMGRQNWGAAIQWALKAAEAEPADKYWRYLNAADFASRDHNADLAIKYATLVLESDIATKVFGNKSFDWLRQDARWIQIMDRVEQLKEKQRQQRIKASLVFREDQRQLLRQNSEHLDSLTKILSVDMLYKRMRNAGFAHTYSHSGRYKSHWLKLSDSLELPYLVQLPVSFDPNRHYPVIVVLHGAITRQTKFPDMVDSTFTGFFGEPFVEQAYQSGLIAIFPYGTNHYNWMMPDDGFEMVPELVKQVKKMYSIDDRRVYVAGHSNGATGAFSYLMKQPGLFAGFAGVNNRPQVRTGGTFIKNGINRSFYNVATDYDYYYPLEGHRAVADLANQLNVNWKNQEVLGHRKHSYLINSRDSITKEVYKELFANLLVKQRDPFQQNLYWECDDVKHGRVDWLELNQLDTMAQKATWQVNHNLSIAGWRNVINPEVVLDSTSQAFVFPRRSGAVKASYSNNRFEIETSRVKLFTIYLSPEMVDFSKPVQVVINGTLVFNNAAAVDRDFMLAAYIRDMDHQAIWINRLQLTVP